MIYILQDGMYYAVNPVAYVRDEEHEKTIHFAAYRPETETGSAPDFNEIAQGLVRDFGTEYVITWVSADKTFGPVFKGKNVTIWHQSGSLARYGGRSADMIDQTKYYNPEDIVMYQDDYAPTKAQAHWDRENFHYYRGW